MFQHTVHLSTNLTIKKRGGKEEDDGNNTNYSFKGLKNISKEALKKGTFLKML